MSFENFFDSVYGKNICVYVCDNEENLDCVFTMRVSDYAERPKGRVEIQGENEEILMIPATGEFKVNEEGFRCDTENRIYLFSII